MTSDAAIEIAELDAWYGESKVLHGVGLRVPPGATVALLGRNGAGKTTTLRAIMGIVRRRSGAIRVRGRDVMRMPLHHMASLGIGYVPEERGIFAGLTVQENLRLPPKVGGGGMSDADIHALFPNLAERLTSEGTKLSGGEQQMLAIARALGSGADILLMDELTEGLAPVIVQRIRALIQELKSRGKTIVLVEQNFRFVSKLADHFYVMEEGRVIDEFPQSAVAARKEQLNRLLSL
ncbi:ABC transporter ATP-binding protein [Xenophilus azovorans]|uniref:ABC transporter ATP-binding protein n=1 Tax=Xenophilus azovorans TaxID=151755 RepID=UPI00056FC282|nr:ABC transporter ATP-binding protein [Xenophilus azovorans]